MTGALQENQQPQQQLASAMDIDQSDAVTADESSCPTSVKDNVEREKAVERASVSKVFYSNQRFTARLPSLDEDTELADEDYDSTTSLTDLDSSLGSDSAGGSASSSTKKKRKSKGPVVKGNKLDRLKKVKDLTTEASEKAHRGEEEEAQKLYRNAIQIAGAEISRINFRIVRSQGQPEAARESIQKRLREDLRKVGLIIGKLKTKMAILYERCGDFERAISCCREAMEIYKHQPMVEEASKNNAHEMMGLMKIMMERLEETHKALEGRGALLLMINEYRRSIAQTPDPKKKEELYNKVHETAKKVQSLEIAALGDSHPQIAETLQLLSTVALEHGKYRSAVDYLEKAIKVSEATLGMKHARIGQYYVRLARIHLGQGIESLALNKFHSAAEILRHSEKFARILGSTFNDVAVIYMRRHEYDNATLNLHKALQFYERSLKQQSAERDPLAPKDSALSTDSLLVLRNLGECHMKQEEFEMARVEFAKVLKLQKDARKVYDNVIELDLGITGVETFLLSLIDDGSIADTLLRLGRAEAAAENHQNALAAFKEAIELLNRTSVADVLANGPSGLTDHPKQMSRRDQVTKTLYCIAEECSALEQYDEALRYYNESMRLRSFSSTRSEDKQSAVLHCALCFVGIANVHLGKEEFVRAKKLLIETQDYCNANDVPAKHPVTVMIKHSLKEIMRGLAQEASQRKEELLDLEARAVEETGKEEFEKALSTLTKAMVIRKNILAKLRSEGEDTAEQFHGIACLLRSFGSVYARMGDEENADRAYSDATRLFERSGAHGSVEV